MHTGNGHVVEALLVQGQTLLRIVCPIELIPRPGQYLQAASASLIEPLPVSLFYTESAPGGFIASGDLLEKFSVGRELRFRGPLGRGFSVPPTARKIGLISFDESSAYLSGIAAVGLKQDAGVVVVSNSNEERFPDEVEIQPIANIADVLNWADYLAMHVHREKLPELKKILMEGGGLKIRKDAQVLIRTQMPCGGLADCSVCAIRESSDFQLVCKDGPVFDLEKI